MLKKGLVVIPTQGLCNRLRFLACSSVFCNINNIPLYIHWIPTKECNISIDDFLITDKLNIVGINELINSKTIYYGRVHTNQIIDKINKVLVSENLVADYIIIEGGHEYRYPEMPITDFLYKKHLFYKSLRFTNQILDSVDDTISKIDIDNSIGIHYRDVANVYDKNDIDVNKNLDFTNNSPLEKYIDIIEKTDCNNIIVISNSKIFYDFIKNKFHNKKIISTHPKYYDRDSKEGMICSVVDLLVLSKTNIILGSYYSSFSDEATFFNYIPKIIPLGDDIIKKDKNSLLSYHCHGFSFDKIPIINNNDKILQDIFRLNVNKLEELYTRNNL